MRWLILVLGQASVASEVSHCVMPKGGVHPLDRTLSEVRSTEQSSERLLRDCGIMEQTKDVGCTNEVAEDGIGMKCSSAGGLYDPSNKS